jgi:hypothetical protein
VLAAITKEMKNLIIILTFILTTNCSEKKQITNLTYESDIDKINISEGTLTRRFINGEKTIDFNLDKENLREFLNYLIKSKIETIEKKDLDKECEQIITPTFSSRLEITFDNGKIAEIHWTSNNCGERINDLNEIVEQLYSIIEKDKSIGQLEQTDIIFE